MKKQASNVADIFKEFCKERHAEDKGRNYNLLQDVYANTELFDLTNAHKVIDEVTGEEEVLIHKDELIKIKYNKKEGYDEIESLIKLDSDIFYSYGKYEGLIGLQLPFANCFIRELGVNNASALCVFIREYQPNIYSGTFYIVLENGNKVNIPFQFFVEKGTIRVLNKDLPYIVKGLGICDNEEESFMDACEYIADMILTIGNLPKHSVIADTPIYKSEYYPKKQAQGIRVLNRPIYYVLNKKEEKKPISSHKINAIGNLEYTHAFKVRGHWMRINPNSTGKDRNGIRKETLKGITWRTEYVKGEGELIKKIRIVK